MSKSFMRTEKMVMSSRRTEKMAMISRRREKMAKTGLGNHFLS